MSAVVLHISCKYIDSLCAKNKTAHWTWETTSVLKLSIIISCTHIEPPGGLRSCAASPGWDATPNSPAFSRSCCAAGAGSSSWTQTRLHWSGSGTGLADPCPRRDGEAGDPRLDRRLPNGTTGPPPAKQAPGRRWVQLIKEEEEGDVSDFKCFEGLNTYSHSKMCFCSCHITV